ncbi:hypothetical protein ONS95_008366 [Cadophora gregata]|uniref:uncharacterized protein n=1 Tax=Cadophora gregata TaxID=51156 RepID=UPI0026DAE988|nr:uncharacterized protein ONS95_008366 [Cadophora gregata]KAK0100418.1 hypothetical protein ONS96_007695 [Cadophora gregata f. sp. sojae]KAK0126786.1 hypothetical protein ONS95_008366 [Cadophora gregata]
MLPPYGPIWLVTVGEGAVSTDVVLKFPPDIVEDAVDRNAELAAVEDEVVWARELDEVLVLGIAGGHASDIKSTTGSRNCDEQALWTQKEAVGEKELHAQAPGRSSASTNSNH